MLRVLFWIGLTLAWIPGCYIIYLFMEHPWSHFSWGRLCQCSASCVDGRSGAAQSDLDACWPRTSHDVGADDVHQASSLIIARKLVEVVRRLVDRRALLQPRRGGGILPSGRRRSSAPA